MKTVLVTGSLGVIGRPLTKMLRNAGYQVIGIDLAIRDYSDYVRADVTSFEDLFRVFKKHEIEIVIHMAGEVGRMVGELHPQKMIYVNDVGTLNVIQLCLEYDSRLVYFSTSEVYGRLFDRGTPVLENEIEEIGSPFQTTNMYAMSKLFGEAIVKHHVDNYKLNAIAIRPFMVYGPGEHASTYRSAIVNFVHNALTDQKITVHRGTQRAWCFISDFNEGVKLVLEQPFSGRYEAYNIGSDEYHSMDEVAKMTIEEAGGSAAQIEIVDPPSKFLSPIKKASIQKMRSIGYEPKVTLREGLQRVIAEHKRILAPTQSGD